MNAGLVLRGCLWGMGVWGMLLAGPASAANEAETADLLIKFVQSGRQVVSEQQDLINDAAKGDKGFTADVFAEKAIVKFREKTEIDLSRPTTVPASQQKLLTALLDSGKEVVAEAQMIINRPGIGFKGFIPAVWGRKTGEKFGQKTGIRLKLTAMDYRYPGNKPDEFELEVLRLFSDPSYPKGKDYSRTVTAAGKPALRVMAPEYATAKCLKCHGDPKGERDITGNKKEGIKEGGLAGAISIVLPVQ